ncbi:MAG TPA: hypothetical protein VKX17_04975 [Planctomycetota bacterium]|nr:hypothetical protein [Planctomycetota bacterium]
MADKPTILERLARWTRFVLLAGIAIVLGLIITTPRNQYPLTLTPAQAAGISSTPGFILTTVPSGNAAEKFCLLDSNNKVICIYSLNGDQLLLTSARKFDFDNQIPDGTHPMKNIRISGNANGISRDEARIFLDGWKEFIAKQPK